MRPDPNKLAEKNFHNRLDKKSQPIPYLPSSFPRCTPRAHPHCRRAPSSPRSADPFSPVAGAPFLPTAGSAPASLSAGAPLLPSGSRHARFPRLPARPCFQAAFGVTPASLSAGAPPLPLVTGAHALASIGRWRATASNRSQRASPATRPWAQGPRWTTCFPEPAPPKVPLPLRPPGVLLPGGHRCLPGILRRRPSG
jgi:hypothetical protein